MTRRLNPVSLSCLNKAFPLYALGDYITVL